MFHLTFETLNLYLDNQLDANARVEANAHLAACAQCRRELDALRAVYTALDALEPENIPADVTPRVLERLAPQRSLSSSPLALGLLAAQLALTIVLAVVVIPALFTQPLTNVFALPGLPVIAPPIFLSAWHDALALTFQDAFANLPRLGATPQLGAIEWIVVIGAIGIVWLVGNRVLLSNLNGARGNKREAIG